MRAGPSLGAALLAGLAVACAGAPSRELPERAEDPVVAAALHEARAADERRTAGSPLDQAELRVRAPATDPLGLGAPDDDGRRRLELAARLTLKSPFAAAAEREASEAEVEAAFAAFDRVALDRREELCVLAVQAGHRAALAEGAAATLRALAPLEAPLSVDPAAFEAHARLLRFRLEAPSPPPASALQALPALPAPGAAPLDRRPETLLARLRSAPGASVSRHREAALLARSDAELHGALPRLGYLEAGVQPGELDPVASTVVRAGLEVPLGGLGAAREAEHLARAARAEGEADERARFAVAEAALEALVRFEASAPDLAALQAAADRAELLAAAAVEAGTLPAADALARHLAAWASRTALLDARARAGEARCRLEGATGGSLAAWPRVP